MKRAGGVVRIHFPQSPDILSLYDEMGCMLMEAVPINWWGNDFSGKGDEVLDEGILAQAMPALERMIQRAGTIRALSSGAWPINHKPPGRRTSQSCEN
jgi:hypothetical protein